MLVQSSTIQPSWLVVKFHFFYFITHSFSWIKHRRGFKFRPSPFRTDLMYSFFGFRRFINIQTHSFSFWLSLSLSLAGWRMAAWRAHSNQTWLNQATYQLREFSSAVGLEMDHPGTWPLSQLLRGSFSLVSSFSDIWKKKPFPGTCTGFEMRWTKSFLFPLHILNWMLLTIGISTEDDHVSWLVPVFGISLPSFFFIHTRVPSMFFTGIVLANWNRFKVDFKASFTWLS